ncbi:hypothetical protein PINS_up024044 [Pythium insidiosum]|nr:hypothetical protein PINS_up024044 [Pythium insidiosum]
MKMKNADDKQIERQGVLARLLHDSNSKETLCRADDYPEAQLEHLNEFLVELGPIVNPVFGEQAAFFIDEGYYALHRIFVYGDDKAVFKIGLQLGKWIDTTQ